MRVQISFRFATITSVVFFGRSFSFYYFCVRPDVTSYKCHRHHWRDLRENGCYDWTRTAERHTLCHHYCVCYYRRSGPLCLLAVGRRHSPGPFFIPKTPPVKLIMLPALIRLSPYHVRPNCYDANFRVIFTFFRVRKYARARPPLYLLIPLLRYSGRTIAARRIFHRLFSVRAIGRFVTEIDAHVTFFVLHKRDQRLVSFTQPSSLVYTACSP